MIYSNDDPMAILAMEIARTVITVSMTHMTGNGMSRMRCF